MRLWESAGLLQSFHYFGQSYMILRGKNVHHHPHHQQEQIMMEHLCWPRCPVLCGIRR